MKVDVLEKLPIPFGLIRYGVAPDHGGVKASIDFIILVIHKKIT